MAIDSGSGSKSRDNSNNNSKNKLVSKGSSSYDSGKTDRFTRSSVKENSSKLMEISPASKRKSERLEKRTPSMPPAKKKSAGLEQQNTPSPLRRSERCSTLSRSKHLGTESSLSSIKEEKREKIVKKLTMESESVSTTKKNATTPVNLKRKKMDDRTDELLSKKQKKEDTASGRSIVLLKFYFLITFFLLLFIVTRNRHSTRSAYHVRVKMKVIERSNHIMVNCISVLMIKCHCETIITLDCS